MSQQLLLEGQNLEALILRARKEYGPSARVVRAEKVRAGGFLGFFTREHFELTVEISDADIVKAATTRAPVEVVRSRAAEEAALAAEIADAQAARESMLAGSLGDYAMDYATDYSADTAERYGAAPMAFTDGFPSAPVVARQASGDSLEFDRLVMRLTEQAEAIESPAPSTASPTTASPRTAPSTTAPSTTAPAATSSATTTAPASAHAPSASRAFVPATFPIAKRQASVIPGLDATRRVGAVAFREDADDQDSRDSVSGGRVMTESFDGGGDAFRGLPTGPDDGVGDEVPPSVASQDSPSSSQRSPSSSQRVASTQRLDGVVLHRWGVFTDVASAVATHCTVPALLALGVPMRCVDDYADLGSPVPLLDVVARFATPPVRRPEPGDLIVIAGPAEHALAVAKQLAGWVGLPPTAVVLAGQIDAIRGHGRRIRDEAQARAVRARAEKAGRFGEPMIVALGVTPGRRGAASSAPLLAAFVADTVWAVVDATKRPSTYEPSVRLLAGEGRIDGLAAVNVSDAQAPCAMLDASLPVAWMDGLPAAGVVWAALLAERIAAID